MNKWQQAWQTVIEQLTAYNFEQVGESKLQDEQDGGTMEATLSNTMESGIVVKLTGGFDFEVVQYNAEVLWHSGTLEYAGFLELEEAGESRTLYAHGFATDIVECIKAVEALTGEGRHPDWWNPS